jgi:hypothetical protein
MLVMNKNSFYFRISYFKDTGKFYTEEVVYWEVGCYKTNGKDTPYTPDVVAKVRGLRDCGGPGALPV